ncbi:MAG: glycosyltransferase family 1 protein [Selenomonadaceae bacterium]|nr:glycosyltransferase family 1 protein [Selenomonadaceae bacterium]
MEKIKFFLENDELREKIALAGYNSVMKNCTLKKSVEKLLAESEIVRGFY